MRFFDVDTSLKLSIPMATGLMLFCLNSEKSLTPVDMAILLAPLLLQPSVNLTVQAAKYCLNNK